MQGQLQDKRILVTGGATGIGRQISLYLAQQGAVIFINYRTRYAEAQTLQREIEDVGGRAYLVEGNVSDPDHVQKIIEVVKESGGVHAFVHAASAPITEKKFRKTDWQAFDQQWQVAVHGAYLITQGLLSLPSNTEFHLESIVFILSTVTIGIPPSDKSAYVTAKYALLGLARSLAVELANRKIRVNSVSPGFTPTPLTAYVDERIQDLIRNSVPLQRLCSPEDVAWAVTYLVSPHSSYVTGVNLPLSGGTVM